MEKKNRLFIYDRKEMGVLMLLGVMVAVFAFTLGVHLGKRAMGHLASNSPHETTPVGTVPDQIPDRQELTEQSKGAQQAADDSLNQALHDEVARTGIKLDTPRQVDLPKNPVSQNAGATTLGTQIKSGNLTEHSEPSGNATVGKYTLQVGSYPVENEAKDRIAKIELKGLKPFLREAEIQGKGKWFRVYLGGFSSKDAAEEAGMRYRADHVIDSFIVAKLIATQ